jgi:hypothetical protein
MRQRCPPLGHPWRLSPPRVGRSPRPGALRRSSPPRQAAARGRPSSGRATPPPISSTGSTMLWRGSPPCQCLPRGDALDSAGCNATDPPYQRKHICGASARRAQVAHLSKSTVAFEPAGSGPLRVDRPRPASRTATDPQRRHIICGAAARRASAAHAVTASTRRAATPQILFKAADPLQRGNDICGVSARRAGGGCAWTALARRPHRYRAS